MTKSYTIFVGKNMGGVESAVEKVVDTVEKTVNNITCSSTEYIAANKYKANNAGTASLPSGNNRAKMVLNPYGYFILYDGAANPSFTAQYLSQPNTFNELRDKGKAYYLSPKVFRTEKITNPLATRAIIQSGDGNLVVDIEGITNDNKNGNRDKTWALNRQWVHDKVTKSV